MRRLAFAMTALLVALGAGFATAEIYRWTDAEGRLHFSQTLDAVPASQRAQAEANARGSSQASSEKRGSFQRYSGPSPDAGGPGSTRRVRIRFERENSLMRVTATVNGHLDIPFYVDTGASGVSIPAGYASRLGIQVGPDTQRVSVRTANGVIQVPLVRLDSVRIGGAKVEGLMATLNPTMPIGLLGGAFFNRFNYEVDPAANVITLVPNHGVTSGIGEEHWRVRFRSLREPLAELERYLEGRESLRPMRRAKLERKRVELQEGIRALEIEADRDDVPLTWRR
jgi:clan AA aspartic protease (TIGR02281 family)